MLAKYNWKWKHLSFDFEFRWLSYDRLHRYLLIISIWCLPQRSTVSLILATSVVFRKLYNGLVDLSMYDPTSRRWAGVIHWKDTKPLYNLQSTARVAKLSKLSDLSYRNLLKHTLYLHRWVCVLPFWKHQKDVFSQYSSNTSQIKNYILGFPDMV